MALCTLIHASSIDWSDTTYWKGGSVPANGDDVIIPRSVQGTITAGLAQSAVTLNSLIIEDGASPKTQGTLEINTGILTWYGNSSSFRLDGDVTQAAYLGPWLWKAAVEKAGSFDIDKIREASPGIELMTAPEGYVRIHENHHLWSKTRIGVAKLDGQYDVIHETAELMEPDPFPEGYQ